MFHSVYSRATRRGDGNGGYVTYVAGDDTGINRIADAMGVDMIMGAVDLLVDEGYQFTIRTNEFHEMLEVAMSRKQNRWQDTQVLQVVGSEPYICLRDLLVLYYTFFRTAEDWIVEALEIDLQEPDTVSPEVKNLPSILRSPEDQVELDQSPKKGGKKTNTDEF